MALEQRLAGMPAAQIGAFDDGDRLRLWLGGHGLVDDAVAALAAAWKREGRRS
jgi:hypothetical protein